MPGRRSLSVCADPAVADAIRITVLRTRGSIPRETGTQMIVRADGIVGTIGGGALEWRAMEIARAALASGAMPDPQTFPLGPDLGQCCGGAVTLGWERAVTFSAPDQRPLWIFGAGHVGRALVDVLSPLPALSITWIDTAADRFPDDIPETVTQLVATNPADAVRHAPADAGHLILTYSHALDLDLCHRLLTHGFAHAGLIGSATKWARFRRRLTELGHSKEEISRIRCPIGQPELGKHPQAIAVGVAAQLLSVNHLSTIETGEHA
ncbi:xanthine dehydrogenase accessory protein XdhC [Oceaniovalibus sp. ACAM 378]|uniref:xanthine dehydrogenase accessory protein XdhC n=1 Tax=Oceaniovalibus sp. ACAM 378 TaxID=2599923 RepID=UPI0011D8D8FC|nr:xanthine dehydrogenase accessory protein XdhC [Oceaniovalibus sp. ACAM 378]TYB90806.1 xanthine dehydrogenase accessory protein XdhC [Oceaniovalibus sp. ACAM 378]